MSEISKWKKFANEIKRKQANVATKQKNTKSGQTSKNAGNAVGSSILENKEITVQPLATGATGKAKKYERTGPQEFVPFVFDEVTIPNMVCHVTYLQPNVALRVLGFCNYLTSS